MVNTSMGTRATGELNAEPDLEPSRRAISVTPILDELTMSDLENVSQDLETSHVDAAAYLSVQPDPRVE